MKFIEDNYEIRLGKKSDIPNIMCFIENYWKSGHIMARNRDFFEYEFLEADGTVNFILAIGHKTGNIEGLIGFIYASSDREKLDLWGSIWKVKPGNSGLLGVELLLHMEQITKCRYDLGIGANPTTTIPIVEKLLHRKVGRMKHYYRLANMQPDQFKIARIEYLPPTYSSAKRNRASVVEINTIEELKACFDIDRSHFSVPYKDYAYIEKRYYKHPIYHYLIWGIDNNGSVEAILVCREQRMEERSVLRIVDYLGDRKLMAEINWFWKDKLSNSSYEYIDFYCYGFEDKFLKDSGFSMVMDGDKNIIPDYFYPFLRKNIDIWVHSPVDEVVFCKADGDQDRPN